MGEEEQSSMGRVGNVFWTACWRNFRHMSRANSAFKIFYRSLVLMIITEAIHFRFLGRNEEFASVCSGESFSEGTKIGRHNYEA